MRAPDFWHMPPGRLNWRAIMLSPLGWLYAKATARRVAGGPGKKISVPVVCVGNLNVGGTGKTPTVIWMVDALRSIGHVPHVVTRGYGGSLAGPTSVDPARHKADQTGDEALLLAAFADVWVAKDRAAGAETAVQNGATVIVLDDGFQNPSLEKDFSIVVVDAGVGFGNGRCLPAGPLREPVEIGLKRADLVLGIGPQPAQEEFDQLWGDQIPCPRFNGELIPLQTGMDWSAATVLAFAGIGNPKKFFSTLSALGARIVRAEALDDHQPLTATMMSRLESEARSKGAQLVTTEKDAARLPPAYRSKVITLPVRLQIENHETLTDMLRKAAPAP